MAMITTMKKLKSGYINGTRVTLGNLGDFLSTSAITNLSFLGSQEDGYPDKLNPQVQQYLEEHLLKAFSHKWSLLTQPHGRRNVRSLRRKMSVRGAIKKTRSINVDSDTLGMEGECLNPSHERKSSWLDVDTVGRQGRSPSPAADDWKKRPVDRGTSTTNLVHQHSTDTPTINVEKAKSESPIKDDFNVKVTVTAAPRVTVSRHRCNSESGSNGSTGFVAVGTGTTSSHISQYAEQEVAELLAMLREGDSLEEQGDILQYLVDTHGLDFNTGTQSVINNTNQMHADCIENGSDCMLEMGRVVTVKDLLKGLYEKACQQKLWGLVRHTAGMLGKRVEDLAKAVTDLLVRQKQITVGMPPSNEHTITAPLPENELRQLIHLAYGDDESTAMLTQELLVYLAMFIRTEPQLFLEMLRLRVGLIIQVMATELSRTLSCDGEEASEHLLNLSPFEMKNLLHHILSGKEFAINSVGRGNMSVISQKSGRVSKKSQIGLMLGDDGTMCGNMEDGNVEPDRQGQWLRRRRLDGALNRVPRDFYPKVWSVLEKCQGLAIEGKVLPQNLTQEMTSGELKFALAVETVLNSIPQPEYRQLVVEALMVLTLVAEYNVAPNLGGIIAVEHLVHKGNQIFLDDQIKCNGDATLCCAKPTSQREASATGGLLCGGAAYVCQHFYDSAPSGSYGTMTYITRAVATLLDFLPKAGELDCSIS